MKGGFYHISLFIILIHAISPALGGKGSKARRNKGPGASTSVRSETPVTSSTSEVGSTVSGESEEDPLMGGDLQNAAIIPFFSPANASGPSFQEQETGYPVVFESRDISTSQETHEGLYSVNHGDDSEAEAVFTRAREEPQESFPTAHSSFEALEEVPLVAPRSSVIERPCPELSSEDWIFAELASDDSPNGSAHDEFASDDSYECINRNVKSEIVGGPRLRRKSIIGPFKGAIRSTAHIIEDLDRKTKPLQDEVSRRAYEGLSAIGQALHDTALDGMDTIDQIDLKQGAASVFGGIGTLMTKVGSGGYAAVASLAVTPLGRRIVDGVDVSVSKTKLRVLDASIAVLSGLRNRLDKTVNLLDGHKVAIDEKLKPFGLPKGEVVAFDAGIDEENGLFTPKDFSEA